MLEVRAEGLEREPLFRQLLDGGGEAGRRPPAWLAASGAPGRRLRGLASYLLVSSTQPEFWLPQGVLIMRFSTENWVVVSSHIPRSV